MLAEAIEEPLDGQESAFSPADRPYDAALSTPVGTFGLIIRDAHTTSTLAAVRRRIQATAPYCPEIDTWLLCVSRMPPAAAASARQMGLAWLDSAGNAAIRTTKLRVLVTGRKPAAVVERVKPLVTAPAERQVAVALLGVALPMRPSDLVRATDVNPVQVQRLLVGLEQNGVIERGHRGAVVDIDRARLLRELYAGREKDAWRWLRGHVAGFDGGDLPKELAKRIERAGLETDYAVTGLAAAIRLTGAGENAPTVAVYVAADRVLGTFKDEIGFVQGSGGPVALRISRERAVHVGVCRVAGVRCVAPSQAYLDMTPDELDAFGDRDKLCQLATQTQAAVVLETTGRNGATHDA